MIYECIQHIERGPYCGPDCDEMTRQWNETEPIAQEA